MDSYNMALITRTFQQKKTINNFNEDFFVDNFGLPLKRIMEGDNFDKVFIVINTDPQSPYSEIEEDSISPSEFFIKKYFMEELKLNKIEILKLNEWGDNIGSGQALNLGAKTAYKQNFKYIMNWSSEMKICRFDIIEAIETLIKNNHDVIGFLRAKWWLKYQWSIAQNTANIWNLESLINIGCFDIMCDTFSEYIDHNDFGKIPLLGMEDFNTMLKMMHKNKYFSWGMIKNESPIYWDTDFSQDPKREYQNNRKIYRQEKVINYYIEKEYNTKNYDKILSMFFSNRKVY